MKRMVLGIDEAGRGPVIGPMIICGVLATESSARKLREMGVTDSKALTPKRRRALRGVITEMAEDRALVEVSPAEIDEAVRLNGLGRLEAQKMAKLIEKFDPDVAYVDAPGRNPKHFLALLTRYLGFKRRIVAENFADQKYTIVGAASILAKVRRDEIIAEYHEIYGDFGSGYASDERTIGFLRKYYAKHRNFPPIVRMSWGTRQRLVEEMTQAKLSDLLE